ncbi:MAG: DUF1150 family protein [Pseudomonadota bacterium]
MNTPYVPTSLDQAKIVYVRQISRNDLPEDLQAEAPETLYAIHGPNGERLALAADRSLAFAVARQHDYAPVSVH